MKILACIFLLFAVVYGKKELKSSNCRGRRVISRLDGLWDDKRRGPIDRNSVLNIKYTTALDTHGRDPFAIDVKVSLSKYMVFGYVPLPRGVMDMFGKSVSHPPELVYRGSSVLRASCMFKRLFGHCMPPKGVTTHKQKLRTIADQLRKAAGGKASLANGWFKLRMDGTTAFGKTAFCFDLEFKLQLT